jgi:hypothetical protein
MKRLILGLFVFSLSVMCTSFAVYAQSIVRTTGMSTIYGGAMDIARSKAIDNALRNAVEEKAGVMINSSTFVENFQVKWDQILSESKGFINTYKVISEEKADNSYKVTIEADVGEGKLKDSMSAIGLIMARKEKPRLMIIFSDQGQKDAIAEASMANYFISQGFSIVDAESIKKTKNLQALSGDRREISGAARRYGAEVFIVGRVEVNSKPNVLWGIEVTSNEVVISGKVIYGDTGEIIATDSKSIRGIKETKTMTEEATVDLAKEIYAKIMKRWREDLTNTAPIKLSVFGLNTYQELMRFKDLLTTGVKGFTQLFTRSYANREADIDVEMKGNGQSLADDIAAMTFEKRTIKIQEITPNRVAVNIMP